MVGSIQHVQSTFLPITQMHLRYPINDGRFNSACLIHIFTIHTHASKVSHKWWKVQFSMFNTHKKIFQNNILSKYNISVNTYDVTNIYRISQNIASNYILVGYGKRILVVLPSGNIATGPKGIISQTSHTTHAEAHNHRR